MDEYISKELDELLIKKEKYEPEEEKPVEKETRATRNKELDDDDLLNFIDSTLYKDGEEE